MATASAVSTPARAPYRHGLWWFVPFFLAMVVAFWPSYFSRIAQQPTYHAHAHGLAMILWCALLIVQPLLVRLRRPALHRRIGTLSYLLVPLIVITTVNFIHFRVQGATQLGAVGLYVLALILNALVVFVILFGLAIRHRRDRAVHSRYMLCTIFPLFTPITDRLIGAHMPFVAGLVPRIDGAPILPTVGFLLADVLLIGLALWDWRTNRRADVFPVALGLLVAYHVSVLTFHRLPAWAAFGEWFAGLPLS